MVAKAARAVNLPLNCIQSQKCRFGRVLLNIIKQKLLDQWTVC